MFKFDLCQASSKRGLIWVIGGVIALIFLWFSTADKALVVMAITSTVAGGLGVALDDKGKKEIKEE